MRRWLVCRWPLVCLATVWALACAALPEGVGDKTAVSTNNAVPTAASSGGGDGTPRVSINPNNAGASAAGTIGKSAAMAGVSLRWHADARRCLSRSSTTRNVGDAIVMATCSADARQAFTTSGSNIVAGGGYCLAADGNGGPLFLDLCTNSNTALWLSVGEVMRSLGIGPQGYIVPSDASGAVGQPILLQPKTPSDPSPAVWDLIGVGNVGGSILSIAADPPQFCLARRNDTVALVGCDRTVTEQRWTLDGGILVNDTGQCLTCDLAATTCHLQSCQTVTRQDPNDQRWRVHLFVTYNHVAGELNILSGDTSTQKVALNSNTGSFGWRFGGALP